MKLRRFAAAALSACSVSWVHAAAPAGTLDIAGLGNARVSVTGLDFSPFGGGTRNFLVTGGGAPCTVAPGVGGSCTPSELVPSSPFLPTQNPTGVSMSWSMRGTVTDLTDGAAAPYSGLFTMNLTRPDQDTIPEVLTALDPRVRGFVESSWSAELTSTVVPEPPIMLLLGVGLLMVGAVRFRILST